jgi:hypothetical protein
MAGHRIYDAKTTWTNSLFLDFAESELTRFLREWRAEHGLSDFPTHASLRTTPRRLSRSPPP